MTSRKDIFDLIFFGHLFLFIVGATIWIAWPVKRFGAPPHSVVVEEHPTRQNRRIPFKYVPTHIRVHIYRWTAFVTVSECRSPITSDDRNGNCINYRYRSRQRPSSEGQGRKGRCRTNAFLSPGRRPTGQTLARDFRAYPMYLITNTLCVYTGSRCLIFDSTCTNIQRAYYDVQQTRPFRFRGYDDYTT